MSLERLKTLETSLVSNLALIRSMIAEHEAEPARPVAEAPTDPAAEAAGPPRHFRTIYEAIYGAVLVEGPLTLNEVVAYTKDFSWVQINRHARTTGESLVNRGVLVFEESPKPGRLSVAPGFHGDPNPPLSHYLKEVQDADMSRSPGDVVQAFARFHRLYTQRVLWWEHHGAPMRSGYIIKCIKARGVLDAIRHLLTREDDDRLRKCIAAGRPEASLEWLVTNDPGLFPEDLVERAEERLVAHGLNP